jgi:uncharacterized protein (TIGR03067 family)
MLRSLIAFVGILALAPIATSEDKKKYADAHLGKWRQVAAVYDGKELDVGPKTILETKADGYEVTIDGKSFQKGAVKVDREKSPNVAEVKVAEGYLAGKTLHQISKIEGDVLIACIGETLPKEFKCSAGSGHTLSVWIRVK